MKNKGKHHTCADVYIGQLYISVNNSNIHMWLCAVALWLRSCNIHNKQIPNQYIFIYLPNHLQSDYIMNTVLPKKKLALLR